MKTRLLLISFAITLIFILSMNPCVTAETMKLTIATSHIGGGTHPIGTAMGKVISDASNGKYSISAMATGGSTANVRAMNRKDAKAATRLGMARAPAVYWGQNAKDPFKEKQDVLTLVSLYPLTLWYVALKDSGITKWSDLEGHSLAIGGRGGSIYKLGRLAVKYSGLEGKVRQEFFNIKQAVSALKDRRVDAAYVFTSCYRFGGGFIDLIRARGKELVFFPPDKKTRDIMVEKHAEVVLDNVPGDILPGRDDGFQTIAQMWTLIANSQLPDEVAYDIVKLLMENYKELVKYHPAGSCIGPESAVTGLHKLEVHPGAMKYFKEKGWM